MTKAPSKKGVLSPQQLAPMAALAVLDRMIWNQLIVHAVMNSEERNCLIDLTERIGAAVLARGFVGLDAELHKHAILAGLEILMNPGELFSRYECNQSGYTSERPVFHVLSTLATRYDCDFDFVVETALAQQMRLLDAPAAALIGLCERGLASEYRLAPFDYLRAIVAWGVVTSDKHAPRGDASSFEGVLLRAGLLIDFEAHRPARDSRTRADADFALFLPERYRAGGPSEDGHPVAPNKDICPEAAARMRGYSWPSEDAIKRMSARFDPEFVLRVEWGRDFDRIAFPFRLGRKLPGPDSGEILQYFMRLGLAWERTPPTTGTFAAWPTSVGAAMVAIEKASNPASAVFNDGKEKTISGDVAHVLEQAGITVRPRSLSDRYTEMAGGLLQVANEHHKKNRTASELRFTAENYYRDAIVGFNQRLRQQGLDGRRIELWWRSCLMSSSQEPSQ
jgi:hypothetical protein